LDKKGRDPNKIDDGKKNRKDARGKRMGKMVLKLCKRVRFVALASGVSRKGSEGKGGRTMGRGQKVWG